MKVVDLVTIEKLIPIFKNGDPAQAIQVARIKDADGQSCEFNIVVGKGLYQIGERVIYIMPDYCLPDRPLFAEYFAPGGDPKKSKLGKKGRIRATKFNFSFEGEVDPIYSNGIIMPYGVVEDYVLTQQPEKPYVDGNDTLECFDLQAELAIIKYVSDDSLDGGGNKSGLTKGDLPSFLYATDETRIEMLKDHVNKVFATGEELGFTLKRDGSSCTLYVKHDPIHDNTLLSGICSRNQEKKLVQEYVQAYKEEGVLLHPYTLKEMVNFVTTTGINGWMNDATGKFYTKAEVEGMVTNGSLEPIVVEVRDAWVDASNKYGYLQSLTDYCILNNLQLALRGELIGSGNKGSGNKLNLDAQGDSRVIWFGVDDLSPGHATRINYGQAHNLAAVCENLDWDYTPELFHGVYDYDMIIKKCHEYFAQVKTTTGQIVEGIVIRSKFSNTLSCKYINPEYDSKA